MPGYIFRLLSFPGVVIHEAAHVFFCKAFGIRVRKVCYYRLGKPSGYVVHDAPASAGQDIVIGIGPFLINTILGGLAASLALVPALDAYGRVLPDIAWMWLGVAIAMHAFPSTGDASSIWASLWSRKASWLARLIGTPLVLVIYAGAIASMCWFDLIYAAAVVQFVPKLVARMLG